ncbi:DNA cytosine methyltransferase [Streptomyces harbinensis]|uniref:DNA cytosine methyltransferase n=1 Tax=Streptomyces harbinensis TaxID=1176198 RepID=UPI0036AEBA97
MKSDRTGEPIGIADLFSGCGGFTQGFHSFRPKGEEGRKEASFKSVLAVEKDACAAATYAANFAPDPESRQHVHVGEIEHWLPSDSEVEADVVLGGPPCQGFSGLGKENPHDPRNKLWRHYVRIVGRVIRPKIFVIENVDRFLRSPEFSDLIRETKKGGELEDYRLVDPPGAVAGEPFDRRMRRYLLNAADYGVPQARRRAIVIGVRRDMPEVADLRYPVATHRPRPRTLGGDEPTLHEAGTWNTVAPIFERTAKMELSDDLPGEGRPISTLDLHIKRRPEAISRARYRAIPPGGNRKDLTGVYYKEDGAGNVFLSTEPEYERLKGKGIYLSTKSWDSHDKGAGDVMGRLRMNEPSVTIRTEFYKPEKGRYLHPNQHRPITHLEAALIQGFPDDFTWVGSKTEIARQIGNAVPVGLGRAIAGVIHRALRPGSGL